MSDHDPINELTDVVDLFGAAPRRAVSCPVADDGLPELPGPFGAVEMADGSDAPVYSADQVRQAMREAYEAGRAAGGSAGAPEAWQWRHRLKGDKGWGAWAVISKSRYDRRASYPDSQFRELFAAPPPPKDAP